MDIFQGMVTCTCNSVTWRVGAGGGGYYDRWEGRGVRGTTSLKGTCNGSNCHGLFILGKQQSKGMVI